MLSRRVGLKTVNVLGTEYTIIESSEQEDINLTDADGYCDTSIKQCVIDDAKSVEGQVGTKGDLEAYKKKVVMHELIHAFLYESGLDVETWARNEEMVDWIAIQFPKMLKAFQDAEVL